VTPAARVAPVTNRKRCFPVGKVFKYKMFLVVVMLMHNVAAAHGNRISCHSTNSCLQHGKVQNVADYLMCRDFKIWNAKTLV